MNQLYARFLLGFIFFVHLGISGEIKTDNSNKIQVGHEFSMDEVNSLFDCFNEAKLHLVKLVPLLTESGFDPNEVINGETILHRAISISKSYEGSALWIDFIGALNSLALAGIDIEKKYNDKTPMHLAFDLYLIQKFNENEYTLNGLHLAQIIEPFLLVGFDPHQSYKTVKLPHGPQCYDTKETFYDVAIRYKFYEVSDLMLNDNQISNRQTTSDLLSDWKLRDIRKKISLNTFCPDVTLFLMCKEINPYRNRIYALNIHEQTRKKYKACMTLLIENGFDTRKIDGYDRNTVLHQAAFLGNKEIIELLLKNGALDDIETKNSEGLTPFAVATLAQQAESCVCLAQHGADINPLYPHYACKLKVYIRMRCNSFENLFTGLKRIPGGLDLHSKLFYF